MRLYLGNIPYNVTEQEIRDHFSVCGNVNDVKIMTERESGRPRGFGFIDMNDADGKKAIEEMNGSTLGGRTLVVNEARERESRGGGGGGGGGGGRREGRGYRD